MSHLTIGNITPLPKINYNPMSLYPENQIIYSGVVIIRSSILNVLEVDDEPSVILYTAVSFMRSRFADMNVR